VNSAKRILGGIGRHIRTTLVAGLLVTIPVGITFIILRFVFNSFDQLLQPVFEQTLNRYTPGMGAAALVILIYLIGLVTAHVLGRRLIAVGHSMVDRVPVVRGIYGAARQATDVFSNANSESKFTSVVLVDFPGHGLKSLGLVTSKLADQDGNQLLAVYMPTSPFPTSGFLIFMREDQVTPTSMSVDDAMKLIVSAGIVAPDNIEATPSPFNAAPYNVPAIHVPHVPESGQLHPPDNGASNQ
jgi:uncharacterized membrane protein